LHTQPGEVLIAEQQRLEEQTRTGLSRAAATLGGMEGAAVVDHSRNRRDITAAAARVFGWDIDEPQVQVNQLVI
jgi:hypothetical protein